MLPPIDPAPPFNITRASHVALTSRDLPRARDFYTEVIGLKVSHETATTIHFRGAEERGHHSLTLRKTREQAVCERIGFRMFGEEELERPGRISMRGAFRRNSPMCRFRGGPCR